MLFSRNTFTLISMKYLKIVLVRLAWCKKVCALKRVEREISLARIQGDHPLSLNTYFDL